MKVSGQVPAGGRLSVCAKRAPAGKSPRKAAAEENASSGQITKENMNNLEQVMEQCKGSTDKIANVSAELVTQIKKFSGNGLKKR